MEICLLNIMVTAHVLGLLKSYDLNQWNLTRNLVLRIYHPLGGNLLCTRQRTHQRTNQGSHRNYNLLILDRHLVSVCHLLVPFHHLVYCPNHHDCFDYVDGPSSIVSQSHP